VLIETTTSLRAWLSANYQHRDTKPNIKPIACHSGIRSDIAGNDDGDAIHHDFSTTSYSRTLKVREEYCGDITRAWPLLQKVQPNSLASSLAVTVRIHDSAFVNTIGQVFRLVYTVNSEALESMSAKVHMCSTFAECP